MAYRALVTGPAFHGVDHGLERAFSALCKNFSFGHWTKERMKVLFSKRNSYSPTVVGVKEQNCSGINSLEVVLKASIYFTTKLEM